MAHWAKYWPSTASMPLTSLPWSAGTWAMAAFRWSATDSENETSGLYLIVSSRDVATIRSMVERTASPVECKSLSVTTRPPNQRTGSWAFRGCVQVRLRIHIRSLWDPSRLVSRRRRPAEVGRRGRTTWKRFESRMAHQRLPLTQPRHRLWQQPCRILKRGPDRAPEPGLRPLPPKAALRPEWTDRLRAWRSCSGRVSRRARRLLLLDLSFGLMKRIPTTYCQTDLMSLTLIRSLELDNRPFYRHGFHPSGTKRRLSGVPARKNMCRKPHYLV